MLILSKKYLHSHIYTGTGPNNWYCNLAKLTNKINQHSYDIDFLLNEPICICISEFLIPSSELGKLYTTPLMLSLFSFAKSRSIQGRAKPKQKKKINLFAYSNFLK